MSSSECIHYWESCLQDISQRNRHVDATVLLVGKKGAGKTSLLREFCETISNRPTNELISYDYYNLHENEDMESTSKVNVWSFNDNTFLTFADIYLNPSFQDKKVRKRSTQLLFTYMQIVFVIAIDLTSVNCVESLRQWINAIHTVMKNHSRNIDDTKPWIGIPIFVIGTKSDQIRVDNIDSLKVAKSVQGQLRSLCLKSKVSSCYSE